jgi:sirohydrochlorin cobaltochelatase
MGRAVARPLHLSGSGRDRPIPLNARPDLPLISSLPPFALLVAAHGERRAGADNDGVARLAADLVARHLAAEIGVGFIKGVPGVAEALEAFASPEVVVYPLFLADGYFSRVRLPQLIAAAQSEPASRRRIRVLPPLGLDPALAGVVAARAEAAGASFAPALVTLVLLAHGTPRDPASRRATEAMAGRIAASGRFAAVRSAFLEEPPSLVAVLADVAGPAVVVGLFAGDGLHGGIDGPQLVGKIARADVVWAGNAGNFTEIADVVAAAVRDASTRRRE